MSAEAGALGLRLLLASIEASALVLAVFLGRRALATKPALRVILWHCLLLRLALTWMPRPSFTITPGQVFQAMQAPPVGLEPDANLRPEVPPPVHSESILLWMGAGIWVLGAAWVAGRMVMGSVRLGLAVRQGRVATEQSVLEILEATKHTMGLHTPLVVVVTDQVTSPALYGVIRPRLLMPHDMLKSLSEEELRHVFLHELAHLKRLDLVWAWLASLVQVMHWFNPALWWAFRQMRLDREMACDAHALTALPPQEGTRYGQTLLRMLAPAGPTAYLPSLAGIREDASHLSRRIHMIARFQPSPRNRWASVLVATLSLVTFFGVRLVANDPLAVDSPKRQDAINHPYVPDSQVLGLWHAVDFVTAPSEYRAGERQFQGTLHLKNLEFRNGGTTNWAFTWTKGLLIHQGDRTAARYHIATLDGKPTLFVEWKSGDYILKGQAPKWYVLTR